jgi:alpha-amylase
MTLGLFLHSHQPVGNFDWVFEQNWDRAYRPMLEALERHPGVKATLHYSGPLLDWLDEHKPDFRGMVARLVERRQVEIAGGGYYEPILAMLPEADRQGQIRLMQDEIEQRWGMRPRGAWLAERVWEPGLAAPLARAGVEYTLVDDSHFGGTGIPPGQLSGYYVTEDEGETTSIFPGLQLLRNAIPWHPVDRVIAMLRKESSRRPGAFLVMGDDGEKFGAWPDTYAKCWTRNGGWVDRFFSALEANGDWLATSRLDEWIDHHPPQGLVYLPTGAYHEMEEWSLPADQIGERKRLRAAAKAARLDLQELRPGFWRNFLVKYPEAAAMRNRVLRVRRLIDGLPKGRVRSEAERLLWKGENNCPYWHGIFGGVYLRNIRTITTANLVTAESRAQSPAKAALPVVRREDLDLDRQEEVLLRTAYQQVLIDPGEGGAITEWDITRANWPLLTVIARRPEAYHADLAGAKSISPGKSGSAVAATKLVYDPCRRLALQEQLLASGATERAWREGRRGIADLRLAAWECGRPRKVGGRIAVRLETDAARLVVSKTVWLPVDGAGLAVEYRIQNERDEAFFGVFVSEWNVGLPGPRREPSPVRLEQLEGQPARRLDGGGPIALALDLDGFDETWELPVETVSSSEAGLELSYQGLCVGFARQLSVAPGGSTRMALGWTVETL